MNININDKEITLKYTFRGFIIYENIAGQTFSPNGLKEIITLFYSMVMASDNELTLTFDDFITMIDEDPNLLSDFSEWLSENITKSKSLGLKEKKSNKKEKSEKK